MADSYSAPDERQAEIVRQYQESDGKSSALISRMMRSYLRPYIGLLLIGVLTNIVVAATSGAMPWFIQQAIDNVFDTPDSPLLVLIPLGILIASAIRAVATYASNVILNFVGQSTTANLQKDLYKKIVRGDLAFISQLHTGAYISIFMTDTIRLRDTVNTTVIGLARHLITVLALTIVMFYTNWYLAMVYTIVVIPVGLVLLRSVGRRTRKAARQGLEETGGLSTTVAETMSGLRVIKAYGQEDQLIARASENIDQILRFTMKAFKARATSSPIVETLSGIAVAAIIYIGAKQSQAGLLTTGEFMGFITALLMSYGPLRSVATVQTSLQEGVAAAQRIFHLVDTPIQIEDRADAISVVPEKGIVRFDKVCFQYPSREALAVRDLDFTVAAGETIALVGPSGAGKSTILNLILRFFDVSEGSITIDGTDIRDMTLASLRQATALVTQDPFLFDDSIAANIAFGSHAASSDTIIDAAKQAAAHNFIADLPEQYDTMVGEGGLRLSGGQKQRLAIARAILKDAPILLLDEATSALDTASEKLVQESLTRLMQGRTSFIIAHRLSTILHADRIFVMDEGRIVEIGNHDSLLAAGGLYADLYRTQFGGESF